MQADLETPLSSTLPGPFSLDFGGVSHFTFLSVFYRTLDYSIVIISHQAPCCTSHAAGIRSTRESRRIKIVYLQRRDDDCKRDSQSLEVVLCSNRSLHRRSQQMTCRPEMPSETAETVLEGHDRRVFHVPQALVGSTAATATQ